MGWHHGSLLAVVYLSLLTTVKAPKAAAYPTPVDFDGTLLRWHVSDTDPAISYEVKADRDADRLRYESIVDEAARLWTDVPTSYFAYAPVAPGGTAQVTVELKRALDGSAYSAGYAIFDEYDGLKPVHCSIFVVVEDGLSDEAMAKTFLHEFGHCLGLGHTLIPEAIMSYALDKNGFELDIDDQAAATRLYPADGSEPKLPPGCAVGGGTKGGPMALVLLLAPLLAVDRIARRRRRSC